MVQLNVYKNTDSTSAQYGKAYARADYKQTLSVSDLAKLMAEHNTGFSPGSIEGILVDAVKTIREQTLMGNCVKIDNLAIFKCSVISNACSRYGVMKAKIGAKSVRINGQTVETGNAIKSMKLLAVATGNYTKEELNKDATLGWTKAAQEKIDADKAAMNQPEP
ncbi:MAG: hypothetical protein J6V92_02860 [Bacteroidaceae bacterium]|nr:hypothetical protein [Bacteroidaceae bacterium]